ncbi:MAG: hypothetical protein KJT03_21890, partial [Verrucomicrobiae bacterium]|nr:hypothetical protein [Verrucomicrobiae bacterium]
YYPSSVKLFTVDVGDKARPAILASASLLPETDPDKAGFNQWTEGGMKLLGDIFYYGLSQSEYTETPENGGRWLSRHSLGRIDLTEPAVPKATEPVDLPGSFESVYANESGGLVLFTSLHRSTYVGGNWKYEFLIQASAFDGLKAFLMDEFDLGEQGYGARLFKDQYLVVAYTEYGASQTLSDVTTYEWLDSGSFVEYPPLQQTGALYRLGVVDDLLIAPGSNAITVIDFTDPTDSERNKLSFPNQGFWQRVDMIDVYDREFAYLPVGWQGVDILDFNGAFQTVEPFFGLRENSASKEETWVTINLVQLSTTEADGNLVLKGLEAEEPWYFAQSVDPLSYSEWMRQVMQLGEQAEIPSAELDTDGDGLSNAWEYFTGSHPGEKSERLAMMSWTDSDENGGHNLYLGLPYNLHAANSMSAIPQFSYDLDNWADFPEGFESLASDFSLMQVFRMVEPVETLEDLFVRLRVIDDSP